MRTPGAVPRARPADPTLAAWLAEQDVSAFARVDAQLAETTAFLREHGPAHFDAHFLTSEHRCYDRDYTAAHLLTYHVAERVRGERDVRQFVRAWAAGDRPRDVPATAAAILTRHADTTVVIDDFHQSLIERSKLTPYPHAELRMACADHAELLFASGRMNVRFGPGSNMAGEGSRPANGPGRAIT